MCWPWIVTSATRPSLDRLHEAAEADLRLARLLLGHDRPQQQAHQEEQEPESEVAGDGIQSRTGSDARSTRVGDRNTGVPQQQSIAASRQPALEHALDDASWSPGRAARARPAHERRPPRGSPSPATRTGTAGAASRGTLASTRTSWSLRVPPPSRRTRSPGAGDRTTSAAGQRVGVEERVRRVRRAASPPGTPRARGGEREAPGARRDARPPRPGAIGRRNGAGAGSRPGRRTSRSPSRTTRAGPGTAPPRRPAGRARPRTRSTCAALAPRRPPRSSQRADDPSRERRRLPRDGARESVGAPRGARARASAPPRRGSRPRRGAGSASAASAGAEARIELGLEERHERAAGRGCARGARSAFVRSTANGELALARGSGGRRRASTPRSGRRSRPRTRPHAAEPAPSRAAQQAEEHRLDLIVPRVRGRDARRARPPRPSRRARDSARAGRAPRGRRPASSGTRRADEPDAERAPRAPRRRRASAALSAPRSPWSTWPAVEPEPARRRQLGERREQRRRVRARRRPRRGGARRGRAPPGASSARASFRRSGGGPGTAPSYTGETLYRTAARMRVASVSAARAKAAASG